MTIFIVMGVSGCGKSTIGQALATTRNCPFFDGDDFHPPANIAKMSTGTPLTDADRIPWLARLHDLIGDQITKREEVVIACSALKHSYRDQLRGNHTAVQFIYLEGEFDLIWQRMQARPDHFMLPAMLHSQFTTLEAPSTTEAWHVSIDTPITHIMIQIQDFSK